MNCLRLAILCLLTVAVAHAATQTYQTQDGSRQVKVETDENGNPVSVTVIEVQRDAQGNVTGFVAETFNVPPTWTGDTNMLVNDTLTNAAPPPEFTPVSRQQGQLDPTTNNFSVTVTDDQGTRTETATESPVDTSPTVTTVTPTAPPQPQPQPGQPPAETPVDLEDVGTETALENAVEEANEGDLPGVSE